MMLEIYSSGICYCSVCTDIKFIKEIEKEVNTANPTGINNKWEIAKEDFKTGEKNPHACEVFPEKFKHYLLSC